MTRASHVPVSVAEATERKLQRAVLAVLMGELEPDRKGVLAVSSYLAACRESRERMERAA